MKIYSKIVIILLVTLSLTTISASAKIESLSDNIVILEKPQKVVSERTINYLISLETEQVKIWVFFNDKEIFNKSDFDRAVEHINLSDRAIKRRAKIGLNQPVFADLPVSDNYINQIVQLGAVHHRSSRWLNAASFEIDIKMISQIETLPFVNKIKPVARFKRIEVPVTETDKNIVPQFAPSATDALDYGPSATQVSMLNVPAVHNLGYNGQGIIVTIIDSGYRKDHHAFDSAYAEGRVLGEYDFLFNDGNTQNEPEDVSTQDSHGTKCWSILGGFAPGNLIGPAYGATFLLAKTEDIANEYPGEEDNWVAAMEWADSAGTDVISTSLGYSDWYTFADYDGITATTSAAASTAAGLGIIIAKSNGNGGPADSTITAPADAFDIISTGSVNSGESIASSSSRGPTADGRIKPEVCAMGVSTYLANPYDINGYTVGNGTSFAAPLIGGAAAVLLSSNPTLTPLQVRAALMQTADNAATPNNTYGWGIVNLLDAINWGANFTSDATYGIDSLTVQFTDSSLASASNWKWYFGDGDSSDVQNPSHHYSSYGTYDVTLMIDSDEGSLQRTKSDLITIASSYIRGDADNNGTINLLDITYIIAYLYKGGPAPEDLILGDANANLAINILDVTYLIAYLYKGGPAPPA